LGKNANFFGGFDLAELTRERLVVFELVWLLVEAIVEAWKAEASDSLANLRVCGEVKEVAAIFEVANLADLRGCGEVAELAAIIEVEVGRKFLSRKLFEELCTLGPCLTIDSFEDVIQMLMSILRGSGIC
jgi:hypothetical protein